MIENQTVEKSNNQGVKEETLIQTGSGGETDSQVERTPGKAASGGLDEVVACRLGVPHSCADKPGGTTGERDRLHNTRFQCGEIKPQSLCLKIAVGVEAAVGETPSFRGEFLGETHRVLECTQTHPPRNQHQNGPICLWIAGE